MHEQEGARAVDGIIAMVGGNEHSAREKIL